MTHKDPTLLKGEDLLANGEYKAFQLTIASAEWAKRQNESGVKEGLLIHFERAQKPLFCPEQQVNYRLLRAELGTLEPDELVGQVVTLIPVKGDWFGDRNTLAIRVMVTGDKPRPRIGKSAFGTSVVGTKVAK